MIGIWVLGYWSWVISGQIIKAMRRVSVLRSVDCQMQVSRTWANTRRVYNTNPGLQRMTMPKIYINQRIITLLGGY
jgi:hypothetical protein